MSQKKFKKDDLLYDDKGAVVANLHSDENKNIAVIARCGHCGRGVCIPILFSVYCKDIYTAIERVKAIPRVKRDQKDVIIDAFEVSQFEDHLINAISDRDPFLRGYFDKDSPEIQSRILLLPSRAEDLFSENKDLPEDELKLILRTADTFSEEYVLQRQFAPIIQGNRIVYASRYDRKQLLEDYFTQAVLRHGVRKANTFFLSIYYQLYGKDNKLGLVFDNGWFIFREKDGRLHSYPIEDVYYQKLVESGVFERDKQIEEERVLFENGSARRVSAIDKFNRRMSRFNEKQNAKKQSQPGDEE